MCYPSEHLYTQALLWWPRFWQAFHTEQARMQSVSSGNKLRSGSHKPLLSLHISTLKPTVKSHAFGPKPSAWLVKPTGE